MHNLPGKIGNSFALAFVAALGVATILGSGAAEDDTANPIGSVLYVGASASGSVLSFNNAASVFGSAAPDRTLTGLGGPRGIAVDMARNRLYVANPGTSSVLVFDAARTLNGGTAPTRSITGAGTTALRAPTGLALDLARDRLYVTSGGNNAVMIIDDASAASGTAPVGRVLSGATTGLSTPAGVAVDPSRDKLYVASSAANAILVFDNAATVSGDTAPNRRISGAATGLAAPTGLFVDPLNDRLYVANALGNSISVFDAASVANGDGAPARTLSGGASLLNQPSGVFVELGTDLLYVANLGGNQILVYAGAGTVTGATAPRTLSLPAGTNPYGVFVDVSPIVFPSSAALDGQVRSDSVATSAGGSPRTGDDASNLAYRQFYSFDLSRLPAGISIRSATLRLYQANVTVASPYGGSALGSVVVDHMDYGPSLDGTDYGLGALSADIGTLSSDSAQGYKTLDVESRVRLDLNSARGRSQYRLRFSPLGTNGDSVSNYAQFSDAEDSCCVANRPPQLVITIAP